MRILMVKGSSFNREVPQVCYPLGLMYMASWLREHQQGHEIELLDLRCHRNPFGLLREKLESFEPQLVAVSALTCEAGSLHRTAEEVRKWNPGTTVVVGGPHISACTSDVSEDMNIDVLVAGEGEETFAELVAALEDGRSAEGIAGSACRTGEGMVWGPPREPIADLDTIPFPAWDLVDVNVYAKLGRAGNVRRGRFFPLFTSRGCPFRCYYCHNLFGKRFRARSAGNVIAEIRKIVEDYGVRDIEVYDDIFNLDLDRAKAVCRGVLDLGLLLSFPNGLRADRLDRELVSLLAEAGTTNLAVAVECASPRLQKLIGKNLDLDSVKESITWADTDGIATNGYFMLGFPTETSDEIRSTIDYAEATDLFFASFFIVTPYPGTPLWDQTMSDKESSTLDFGDYNYLSGYFNLGDLSSDELRKLQKEAYKRFYRRKRWKILKNIFRLRLDWRNAAWLWLGRMKDRGRLRSKEPVGREAGETG
jgi:anaerobic magnesium-protoporphyrin IX monomethyl ester cyclase